MTDKPRPRRYSIGVAIDWFFFVFAGLAAIWLAYLLFTEAFTFGWWGILGFVLFWVRDARQLRRYITLPGSVAIAAVGLFLLLERAGLMSGALGL